MASDSSDPPVEPDDPDATVEDAEAPVPNRARKARTWAAAAVVARLTAVRAWLVPRLPRLVVTIVAGWLLLASFPPRNWWWGAVVAFALLAWVLTRPATTLLGGLGYGFLFGLVFYLALLPWISMLVGSMPWVALATVSALFSALFGLFAVVVRRLPGWPIWFALVWAAQEWLKSVFPFGGFPWGAVTFGQTNGPLLPLVQLGGVAAALHGDRAGGIQPDRHHPGDCEVAADQPPDACREPAAPCCCPVSASAWCCSRRYRLAACAARGYRVGW